MNCSKYDMQINGYYPMLCASSLLLAGMLVCSTAALADPTPAGDGMYGAFKASKEWIPPTDPAVLQKLSEWQDRKLGVMIHWGLYSQWGITESWSLVTTRHPWNQRPAQYADLDDRGYQRVYENLLTTFNPVKYAPDRWATAAKDAGVKYMIITTKHHDGFCMWNTGTTDYRITSPRCPFHANPRADIVRVICEAYRRQGLSTGLYFSKSDWHNPQYWLPELGPGEGQGPNYNPHDRPDEWKKFKEFTWRQIEELVSGYGSQDVLWLDGGSVRPPVADIDMDGIAAMARKHQPGLIVVDRTVHGPNENYITPEGEIPEHYLPYPWETCMTMGTGWVWKPNDHFKSAGTLIRNLCRIVARNGNYLVGIGPDGAGEFDPTVYERLTEIGDWLKINGEAIYETRPVEPYEQGECVFTRKRDGTLYVIILAKDDDAPPPESITLPAAFAAVARNAELLGIGPLPLGAAGKIVLPSALRARLPCKHAWVIKLTT